MRRTRRRLLAGGLFLGSRIAGFGCGSSSLRSGSDAGEKKPPVEASAESDGIASLDGNGGITDISAEFLDAHVLFGTLNRAGGSPMRTAAPDASPIREIGPEDYQRESPVGGNSVLLYVDREAGVTTTRWPFEFAALHKEIKGVIAAADFHLPDEPDLRLLVGVNTRIRDLSASRLDQSIEWAYGRGIPLDVQANPYEITALTVIARSKPDTKFVLSPAFGLPSGETPSRTLVASLELLAAHPNVYVRLDLPRLVSSLDEQHDGWLIDLLERAFWNPWGADRLMFGSNWPQMSLSRAHAIVGRLLHDKGPSAARKVYGGNARSVFAPPRT
jgi:predicted TIM-barrel fold metal-dependent hydrolase